MANTMSPFMISFVSLNADRLRQRSTQRATARSGDTGLRTSPIWARTVIPMIPVTHHLIRRGHTINTLSDGVETTPDANIRTLEYSFHEEASKCGSEFVQLLNNQKWFYLTIARSMIGLPEACFNWDNEITGWKHSRWRRQKSNKTIFSYVVYWILGERKTYK